MPEGRNSMARRVEHGRGPRGHPISTCSEISARKRNEAGRNYNAHRQQARTFLGAPGGRRFASCREQMNLVLLLILILLIVGALPTWPYSSGWGYYPSGGIGLLLIILLIVALTRTVPGP